MLSGAKSASKWAPSLLEEEELEFELRKEERVEESSKVSLQAKEEKESENVKVMVRCRPARSGANEEGVVRVGEEERCMELLLAADQARAFFFDAVFGPQSSNELVYMKAVRPLVDAAFQGYNCTLFLYGQTGTGKTYTHSSLTLAAFAHLFTLIGKSNTRSQFLLRASYYELYNEQIRDLFSPSNKVLELRESKARGVYVKDLTCYLVNNLTELEKLKKFGDKKRATAATKMNEHSSRSHSIFSVTIETVNNNSSSSVQQQENFGKAKTRPLSVMSSNHVQVGRLHLIDLAGSERQTTSGSVGARLKEASHINLSLTCLALVIRALTDKSSSHIPYRNSKLTRLLSSSLGGNSKTLLIACVAPEKSSLEETLSTLRFASRAKRIKNHATINEDTKDALLRKYRKQIEELKAKLRQYATESSGTQKDSKGEEEEGREVLAQQLRSLKAKIMVGGENLLDKVEMHERLLEASRLELEEKRAEEAKLRSRLEAKRANIERMAQSKGSLEGQLSSLDEKLNKVLTIFKRTKEEHRDLMSEHESLKESLLQTIRSTSKEIKYADCIIEDYIPHDYLDLINTHASFDEISDEWQIKFIALSGNNIAQTKKIADVGQPAGLLSVSSEATEELNEKSSVVTKANASSNATHRPDPFIRLKDLGK